jgi:pimeloyl-ACP methyl ester carboxylesterase
VRTLPRLPLRLAALAPLAALTACVASTDTRASDAPAPLPSLALAPCTLPDVAGVLRCGTFTVYEDRAAGAGRTVELRVVVLPARSGRARPDPVVVIAGGPGQAATSLARWAADAWYREDRDVVLVDQRGTSGPAALHCRLPGSDDDPQGYLADVFAGETFRRCLRELQARADLRHYGTSAAADDLEDVRRALGYGPLNLLGTSYGTRAALEYMRRHPHGVRTAILSGLAPIALTNPLHHARAAQGALDLLLDDCASDAACAAAFPALREELRAVVARLDAQPARVAVRVPGTGGEAEVTLTRGAFAEALRVMMYNAQRAREVPYLIHRAHGGDLTPFAEAALASNRGIRGQIAFGMLMSVICAEDVDRIDPAIIPAVTEGTLLGDARVRGQMAACASWPRGEVPADYGEPVRSAVPTLLLSGTLDPVTPPEWGEEAARHLPNALHVVAPGAHGVGGPCIEAIQRRFLATASVRGLDTACVAEMRLPPFRVPGS